MDELTRRHREFLKDSMRKQMDFSRTDQRRGVPPPPVEKPFEPSADRIKLYPPERWRKAVPPADLVAAMGDRRSRRRYTKGALSMAELSFLLWATQGVREKAGPGTTLRTVPSAGARHCFETYVFAMRVTGVPPGLYRYLPVENELLDLGRIEGMESELSLACFGQDFVGAAAATLVWTAVPYRMEWRYGLSAHRVIPMDAGHVCQNLYLAVEAIDAGTCGVAAYDQEAVDRLIGVDGEDEFAIYLAPVGKVEKGGESSAED